MKILIALLLVLFSGNCFAGGVASFPGGGVPAAEGASYAQTCTMEGDIACETDDFDVVVSDPDWDKTAHPCDGDPWSECLEFDTNDRAYYFLPDATEIWVTFMYMMEDDPTNSAAIIIIRDESSNILSQFYQHTATDKVYVGTTGGTSSASSTLTYAPDTTYYMQLRMKKGTSSDTELEFWTSTDGTTWDTVDSGVNYSDDGTSYGQPFELYIWYTSGVVSYYDLFKVSTTGFITDATDDL